MAAWVFSMELGGEATACQDGAERGWDSRCQDGTRALRPLANSPFPLFKTWLLES